MVKAELETINSSKVSTSKKAEPKMSYSESEEDFMDYIDDAFKALIDKTARFYRIDNDGNVVKKTDQIKKFIAEKMLKGIPADTKEGIKALKQLAKRNTVNEMLMEILDNEASIHDVSIVDDSHEDSFYNPTKDIVEAAKAKLAPIKKVKSSTSSLQELLVDLNNITAWNVKMDQSKEDVQWEVKRLWDNDKEFGGEEEVEEVQGLVNAILKL